MSTVVTIKFCKQVKGLTNVYIKHALAIQSL